MAPRLSVLCLMVVVAALQTLPSSAGTKKPFNPKKYVTEWNGKDAAELMGKSKRHVVVFYDPNAKKLSSKLRNMQHYKKTLEKVARKLMDPKMQDKGKAEPGAKGRVTGSGNFNFIVVEAAPEYTKIMERFNVDPATLVEGPAFRALLMLKGGNSAFRPKEDQSFEFTEEGVHDFCMKLRSRDLDRTYMSEAPSRAKYDEKTNIHTATGGTLYDTVRPKKPEGAEEGWARDVVAFMYMPGCQHCKRFREEFFEPVALQAKEHSLQIKFVQMNVASNEFKAVSQSSVKESCDAYPCVWYFPFTGKSSQFDNFAGEIGDFRVFLQFFRNTKGRPIFDRKLGHHLPLPWKDDEKRAVQHLVDEDWDEWLEDNPAAMVMFYAPWCPTSTRVKGSFASVAHKVRDMIPVAAVNCMVNSQTCGKVSTPGFPTIKLFTHGEERGQMYTGPRSEHGLMEVAEMVYKEAKKEGSTKLMELYPEDGSKKDEEEEEEEDEGKKKEL